MKKFTEKLERRVGQKLGLKPERCDSAKCAATRRPYPPGVHGTKKGRRRITQRGQQMLERKKLMASYLLAAEALHRVVSRARARALASEPHNVAEQLLQLLERRLDNTVWRAGFAPSRSVARQLVGHGHITLQGHKITVTSMLVRSGDVIAIRLQSRAKKHFASLSRSLPKHTPPAWITLSPNDFSAKVIAMPAADTKVIAVDFPFLIELYAHYKKLC